MDWLRNIEKRRGEPKLFMLLLLRIDVVLRAQLAVTWHVVLLPPVYEGQLGIGSIGVAVV